MQINYIEHMIKMCGILKVNKKFYTKRNSQDAIIIFQKK